MIRLPGGTLGDVYIPISIQLAVRVLEECLSVRPTEIARVIGHLPDDRNRPRELGTHTQQHDILEDKQYRDTK